MTALLLGPVAFDRFEVPAQIGFGGRQRVHVHTLVGGARVVDAMGAEDAPIGWRGVFSGPAAVARARAVDAMRVAAVEVELAWGAFFYTVLVTAFEAQFERENWIPYRIACVVTFDPAAVAIQAASALLETVAADLATAAGFGGDVADADAALALAGAASAGSADAATARQAIGQAADGTDAQLTGGGAALMAADDVPGAAAAAGTLAQAAAARGFLRRAQANFAAAGGG